MAGGYNGIQSLQSAETYDPVTGTWSPATNMGNIRYGHTATLLLNGRVLVVGGWTGSAYLSGAEIYDPATNTWTSTSNSMTTSRYVHNATLLSDGRVLVTGGYNMLTGGGSLNSAEIYDPATGPNGTWSETTFLSAARHYHTATLLPNSKVLVSGGSSNTACLDSAELYDPIAKTWTPTSNNLNAVRALHSASLLPNGKVLVTGGYNSLSPSQSPLDSAEVFHTGIRALQSSTASLPVPIGQPSSTLLPDGRVLSTGGYNGISALDGVEIYNYAEGVWNITGSLTNGRYYHQATLLSDGKVLVSGGANGGTSLDSAELYDPGAGTWSETGSLISTRSEHTATLLPNGKVLVAGGYLDYLNDVRSSAELYDPTAGT